jgi:hypothetical protein
MNGSCDTFQTNCETYDGQFVTANITYYTDTCDVEFRDINFPLCIGWDCDETEVQDFINYIALTPTCDDDDQNVPITTYGGPIIDSYPNDTNDVCYVDMFNLFFVTEVYGEGDEFEFDNMNATLCEANDGYVLTTTIGDATNQNDNDLCTSVTDVPLCYSDSCSASEAKTMLEYYFNEVTVLSEEEACDNFDVMITTIAPSILPSVSIAPTSSPTFQKIPKSSKFKKSSKSKKVKSKKSSKGSKAYSKDSKSRSESKSRKKSGKS